MSGPDLHARITAGLERLFLLPVLGAITRDTFDALDLEPVLPDLIKTLLDKSELTSTDGQLHSGSFIYTGPVGLMVVLNIMTWPKTLPESREQARETFFSVSSQYTAPDFAGMAQIDAFLGGTAPAAEIRLAWIPLPTNFARMPLPLQRTVLPWGTEPRPIAETVATATGADIVALARATAQMAAAMRKLLDAWPGEDRPTSFGLSDARDQLSSSIPVFNAAVKRVDLEHLMPLSKWDDTWKPHNLDNSLRFHSVAASLEADLLRVWGKQARDDFAQALQLFLEALPDPPYDETALTSIAQRTLERHPEPSVPPSERAVDVFVSYAWADKTRGARDVYEVIRSSGRTAWLDEEQRVQELTLNKDIEAALLHSDRVVICLSLEMLTRGGYALRETLLAACFRRSRCLLVHLDQVPIPAGLSGISTVEWDKYGSEMLLAALQTPLSVESGSDLPPEDHALSGPFVEQLVAPLRRPVQAKRTVAAPNRVAELRLRAKLFQVVHSAFHAFEDGDWDRALAYAGEEPDLLQWSSLGAPACLEDPAVFGAALRLRSVIFRASVQLGAGENWKRHNSEAFELLDAIVGLDESMFRPAPSCGWLAYDCRLAVQDCLDVFKFSEDWFRGWPPDLLVRFCDVSARQTFRIKERIAERVALLAERMLALRAWEEAAIFPETTPSWPQLWSTLAADLAGKLQVGAHPGTRAYFEELGRHLSRDLLDQIATALNDGAVESAFGPDYREELFLGLDAFRLRCIVRCYCSSKSKRESLASVRGTVLNDLQGPGSNQADLNILFSLFLDPPHNAETWRYMLFMNTHPSENHDKARLPAILTSTFLVGEMLNESERERNAAALRPEIFEEL